MTFEVTPNGRFQLVDWVDETGSTNDDLVDIATTDPTTARVLFTELQTAGRGRRDRSWEMVSGGGLLVSFYVPWSDRDTAHLVPTCLGLAAVDAITEVGLHVQLKWPNDLVNASGKKLGGMLSTAVLSGGQMAGVVAGMGCNVSWPDGDALRELPNASSLDVLSEEAGGDAVDRELLASALVRAMETELSELSIHGPTRIHDTYRERCLTLGQRVMVEQKSGELVGLATDIDPTGALLIEVDGIQHRVDVGDVVHLRPQ